MRGAKYLPGTATLSTGPFVAERLKCVPRFTLASGRSQAQYPGPSELPINRSAVTFRCNAFTRCHCPDALGLPRRISRVCHAAHDG